MLKLLQRLQAQYGFACLFISHDLAAVEQVADRVVVMQSGRIVEQGSRDDIFDRPQHDYTKALLAAAPMVDFKRPKWRGCPLRVGESVMRRFAVLCLVMLAAATPVRAESVLRSMITTDIRGLMPGISPDDNTGTVLQKSTKAWSPGAPTAWWRRCWQRRLPSPKMGGVTPSPSATA